MALSKHHYEISIKWTGNRGQGTSDYRSYDRSLIVSGKGKPELLGSSDPAFRGDETKYNPEELLLASLSSCHMLWYLHLCAENKIVVLEYEDYPTAEMVVDSTGGKLSQATLNPSIVIANTSNLDLAKMLHKQAHKKCFIANSINFPVSIKAEVQV